MTPEELSQELLSRLRAAVLNETVLTKVGEKVIVLIKKRVREGIFLEGSSPDAGRYSTNPATMPLGAFRAKMGKGRFGKFARQKGESPSLLKQEGRIYKKAGMVWYSLTGGYKRLRELAGKESDHVTLNWTGSMMKSLIKIDVKSSDTGATVEISFSDYRSAEIAAFHHEGAGKSRKKRIFMALTEEEIAKVAKTYASQIRLDF